MKAIFQQVTLLLWLTLFHAVSVAAQKVNAVTRVGITVADLDREVDFFVNNLDFKKVGEETQSGEGISKLYGLPEKNIQIRTAILQLGEEQIRLMQFVGTNAARPVPADSRSNDLWFQHLAIVVSDIDQAYQKLLKNKVQHVSTFPETLPDYLPNAAGIRAFYFRDPEGHNLELIWFPAGKGNPRWQSPSSTSVFLGIDHTAIAISDTDQSLAFYQSTLGLVVGGHSENYGPEQEHLNQVFGARLDINGLHSDKGFGVEFLRYVTPPGGRKIPSDSKPTDLWHYQTELWTEDMSGMLQRLEKQGLAQVSAQVVSFESMGNVLLRDPDGHAVLLSGSIDKGNGK